MNPVRVFSVVLALSACQGGSGTGHGGPSDFGSSDADTTSPDATPGTPATPYRIDLFQLPYTVSGDTSLGLSTVNSYSCAPEIDEGGSEIWYLMSVDVAIPARFTVTSEEGVDVDLHVVIAESGNGNVTSCLARGDESIDVTVPATEVGANYLVVDSPTVSGVTRPGAYTLTVESP